MMLGKNSLTMGAEFLVTAYPLSVERRSYSLLILEDVEQYQAGPFGSAESFSVIH
jgi:hypothetical protein